MNDNIKDKVILITGASSGLGEAAARLLSDQGATVVLAARRTERIEELAGELKGQGGKALAVTTDVTDREQVQQLIAATVKEYGRVDVLVNNAGLMQQSPLENRKLDEWDNMIDINIKGVLYGIAAVLPQMKEQKAGQIINVSSVAGHTITPAGAVYCATKHAVRVISESLRQEVKPYNLRTTIISPWPWTPNCPSTLRTSNRPRGSRASTASTPFRPTALPVR